MNAAKVVFVGQGPNRTAWQHGIAAKIRLLNADPMTAVNFPLASERWALAEKWAEVYCARVAITGSVGKKLAELGGWKCDLRFNGYARRNLNARWNGKKGKGDDFERVEGRRNADALVAKPFERYVLLGSEVALAFGFRAADSWLDVRPIYVNGVLTSKKALLFPHPSGLNLWWNEDFNRFRARKRLREFLQTTNQ